MAMPKPTGVWPPASATQCPQNLHVAAYYACLEWWRAQAKQIASHVALTKAPFYVLSVANGSPDYDKEIMQLLAQYFPDLHYVIVQPSRAHVRLSKDSSLSKVMEISTAATLEEFTGAADGTKAFHLVHTAFWRNQFRDTDGVLARLRNLTAPNGTNVVFSNGLDGVFDLKSKLFSSLKPSASGCACMPQAAVAESFSSHKYLVGSEVVPSQVDVSTIVNNKPSSYTYRTLGDLLLCDFEVACQATPTLLAEVLSGLRDMSVTSNAARCVVYTPLSVTVAAKSKASLLAPEGATVKTSLTQAVDPWWPHGDKGGFFNVGLRNWNIVRSDWKKRPANFKRPPRPPIVGLADIMDGLSHLCRTYELPSRIALPDMIDIFIDIWDDADL